MTSYNPSEPYVLRYQIPIDEVWHDLGRFVRVVHVGVKASTPADSVEVWALPSGSHGDGTSSTVLRVVGTGERFYNASEANRERPEYIGTAVAGDLVWHVIRRNINPEHFGYGPGSFFRETVRL